MRASCSMDNVEATQSAWGVSQDPVSLGGRPPYTRLLCLYSGGWLTA